MEKKELKIATLAGGCFWCTEAVFQRLEGVENVRSGFTGGQIKNPPYREVVSGRTGHAEAIEFEYDPKVISFRDLLMVFFATHDPTTLNRQQNDVGTQYRSAVFYHDEKQRQIAEEVVQLLQKEKVFKNPIVTEISPASVFYSAEQEHQEFYNRHREQPYCQFIIDPKIKRLQKSFANKLKQNIR